MHRLALAVALLLLLPVGLNAQAVPTDPLHGHYTTQVVSKPQVAGPASFASPTASMLARFRSIYTDDGAVSFVFQADDSLAHPLASVGETLYAYNLESGEATSLTIAAVKALKGSCEAEWNESGWAYSFDVPTSALLKPDEDGFPTVESGQIVFLPAPLKTADSGEVPQAVATSLRKAYDAALDDLVSQLIDRYREWNPNAEQLRPELTEAVRDPEGPYVFSPEKIRVVRQGGSLLYAVGFQGVDPTNAEGVPDPYSILYDESGREVGRVGGDVTEALIGDLTGDETDEIVEPESGKIIGYHEGKWVSTAADQFYYPPCKY